MSLESQLTKLNKALEETNSKLDALLQKTAHVGAAVEHDESKSGATSEVKPASSSKSETTGEESSAPEDAKADSTEATASAPGDAGESSGEDLKEKMREKLIAVREQEGGNDKPREIMQGVGAASIGKIKEEDYQAIIDACDEVLL